MDKIKTAFLFPGSGSHYSGMGESICQQFDVAKQTFEEASDTLNIDIKKLCFKSNFRQLNKIENMLLAIFVVSVASYRVCINEWGISPDFCAGHSLGEYSALTCSNVITFPDALKIVQVRSRLANIVAQKENGIMSIVNGISGSIVKDVCHDITKDGRMVTVACYNSDYQTVISGHEGTVEDAETELLKRGAKITPLIGSAPYHSPLMANASEVLRQELSKYKFSDYKYPVICNVTGEPYKSVRDVSEKLVMQMVEPVQWNKTVKFLEEHEVEAVIEVGPQSVLKKLVSEGSRTLKPFAFDLKEDFPKFMEICKHEQRVEKKEPDIGIISECLVAAVGTENKNWNEDEYENGVVIPYQRILEIYMKLDIMKQKPKVDYVSESLKLLITILETKKISNEEQAMIMNRMLDPEVAGYKLEDILQIS